MPIEFNCPSCERKFSVAEKQAGQRAKCGGCQGVLTVPMRSAPKLISSFVDGDRLRVTCPCGRAFGMPPSSVGKRGTCDQCGTQFLIGVPVMPPVIDLDDVINEGIVQASRAREVPIERPATVPVAGLPRQQPSYEEPPAANALWQVLRIRLTFNSWPVACLMASFPLMLLGSLTYMVFERETDQLVRGGHIARMALGFLTVPLLVLNLLKLPKCMAAVAIVAAPFLVLGLLLMGIGALARM